MFLFYVFKNKNKRYRGRIESFIRLPLSKLYSTFSQNTYLKNPHGKTGRIKKKLLYMYLYKSTPRDLLVLFTIINTGLRKIKYKEK